MIHNIYFLFIIILCSLFDKCNLQKIENYNPKKESISVVGNWKLNIYESEIYDDDFMLIEANFSNDHIDSLVHESIEQIQHEEGKEKLIQIGWLPESSKIIHSSGSCNLHFRQTNRDTSLFYNAQYIHYSTGHDHILLITLLTEESHDLEILPLLFSAFTSTVDVLNLNFADSGVFRYEKVKVELTEQFIWENHTDWSLERLRHNPKSITTRYYLPSKHNTHIWTKGMLNSISQNTYTEDGFLNKNEVFNLNYGFSKYVHSISGDFNTNVRISMKDGYLDTETQRVIEDNRINYFDVFNDNKRLISSRFLDNETLDYTIYYHENKQVKDSIVAKYDIAGNIKVIEYFNDNRVTYRYYLITHFDTYGNWIRRLQLKTPFATIPISIEERIITYYE